MRYSGSTLKGALNRSVPMLDITSDIQSLTTFRRRSGDFMKQLKKTKRPVVLTVKGKAAAIVQDAEAYQRLLDIAATPARRRASVRARGRETGEGPAGEGVFRGLRSRAWHTSLTSPPAPSAISPRSTGGSTPNSDAALKWYRGFKQAILSLEEQPNRCPVTPENDKLRHLLYGNKPHIYRAIYRVLEKQKQVEVLHIRHGARRAPEFPPFSGIGIAFRGVNTDVGPIKDTVCLAESVATGNPPQKSGRVAYVEAADCLISARYVVIGSNDAMALHGRIVLRPAPSAKRLSGVVMLFRTLAATAGRRQR
jgi:prevent-host-death family protein